MNINKEFENIDTVTNIDDIKTSILLCFDNAASKLKSEIEIESDEFTAVCPWTNLPDYGNLKIIYLLIKEVPHPLLWIDWLLGASQKLIALQLQQKKKRHDWENKRRNTNNEIKRKDNNE